MMDSDFWNEVWLTLRAQKWRSLMTAFGVFWGMLMLILLLGASVGLNNGFVGGLVALPGNSIFIVPKVTSMAHQGFSRDREWQLKNTDLQSIQAKYAGVVQTLGAMNVAGEQAVSANDRNDVFVVAGVTPSYYHAMPLQVIYGRFINDIDLKQMRKVCVIGKSVYEKFYDEGTNPCGQSINVGDISYTIVGVIKKTNNNILISVEEGSTVFLPLTTEQIAYNQVGVINMGFVILKQQYSAAQYQPQIVDEIKKTHHIHPKDDDALFSFNLEEVLLQYSTMFIALNLLTWVIGLGTLVAGLIGISNIMMITVKERTQEIGIRRALGAEPATIIGQIMAESLMLTTIAGFVGLCAGLWLIILVRNVVELGVTENSFFGIPQVPFGIALTALLVMILGGVFAGWLPAKKALSIKAIEALKEE